MLREALNAMGRADLIGNGKKQLIPAWQPKGEGERGVRSFSGAATATPRSGLMRPGARLTSGVSTVNAQRKGSPAGAPVAKRPANPAAKRSTKR